VCSGKLVSGKLKLATSIAARATLTRKGRVYATGIEETRSRAPQLVLTSVRRRLIAGRYTLTLRWTTRGRHHVSRQTVTIS